MSDPSSWQTQEEGGCGHRISALLRDWGTEDLGTFHQKVLMDKEWGSWLFSSEKGGGMKKSLTPQITTSSSTWKHEAPRLLCCWKSWREMIFGRASREDCTLHLGPHFIILHKSTPYHYHFSICSFFRRSERSSNTCCNAERREHL